MDVPRTPVWRLQHFTPEHCPWPECPEHSRTRPGYRFRPRGHYPTRRRERIPRFRCLTCGRAFSRQSFSTTYYLKRPELLIPIAKGLVSCSAHRQIARAAGCAPSTVARITARVGRHCLLLLAALLRELEGTLTEPIVLDHKETFELTQDFPFAVATPVGRRSWFAYALDPAPHGRGGRLTPWQRERLAQRPRRKRLGGYLGSTTRMIDRLLPLVPAGSRLELVHDGHEDYARAVKRHPQRQRIRVRRYPNPPRGPKGAPRSREAIVRDRELKPVDAWHALIRHSSAAHKRETIAFGRRLNAILERLYLLVMWRNCIKGMSERKPDPTTPAMRLGLAEEPWSWERLFSRRRFPGREKLTEVERRLYRRDWTTPVLPRNARHRRKHAY